jgi:CheY-like chemotaxis protein
MSIILVAEDDENDIFFLERAHERAGLSCSLQFVQDGEAAIAYLSNPANQQPHFVLLDVKMPRRTGHEVLTWIRSQPSSAFLPVIMLSSSALPADVEKAYRAGANSYFIKSPDSDRLTDMLQVLVKHWIGYHVPASLVG